jgi:hypothetical protein
LSADAGDPDEAAPTDFATPEARRASLPPLIAVALLGNLAFGGSRVAVPL